MKKKDSVTHTRSLRTELIKSLATRLGDLCESDDIFKLATFLDPNFGLRNFQPEMRDFVIEKVKSHLRVLLPQKKSVPETNKTSR